MTGCEAYRIELLEKFEISLEKLLKNHYRKNQRAGDCFMELVEGFILQLRSNPSSDSFSDRENFPKGSHRQDFQFRKIRFRAPELDGAARKCRLMYVIDEARRIVYLLWIYTHKEFAKRPPDDELRNAFSAIPQGAERD